MAGHWEKRPAQTDGHHDVYDFVFDPKPRHKKKFTAISWISGGITPEHALKIEAER